jgi:hypothetical protein
MFSRASVPHVSTPYPSREVMYPRQKQAEVIYRAPTNILNINQKKKNFEL